LGLAGCSARPDENTVPDKFSQALARLFSFSGNLFFEDQGDEKRQFLWRGEMDLSELNNPVLKGTLKLETPSDPQNISLTLEMRHLEGASYFRLSQVNLPSSLPFLLSISHKWYRLENEGTLGDGSKWLGGSSSNEKWDEEDDETLRAFLANTRFFEVEDYLGRETVEGIVSHHFQIKLTEEALKALAQKWGELSQVTASTTAFIQFINRFTNKKLELWLATSDLHPVKLLAEGTGSLDPYPPPRLHFELVISGYNIPVRVEPPKEAEEFLNQGLLKLLPFFSSG